MKDIILAIIVCNENFKGEYALKYLLGKTTQYDSFKKLINELQTSNFIAVETIGGLSTYSPTDNGINYINGKDLNTIIENVKIYFTKDEYFEDLKSYFNKLL
jgi:precorrin-2 methylase